MTGVSDATFANGLTEAAGLRYTDFVTQFPSQFTTAMSFDRELVRGVVERYSAEFAGKGVNVQLGPVGRVREEHS